MVAAAVQLVHALSSGTALFDELSQAQGVMTFWLTRLACNVTVQKGRWLCATQVPPIIYSGIVAAQNTQNPFSFTLHIVPFVLKLSMHSLSFPCHSVLSFSFSAAILPSFIRKVFLTYCPEWHFVVNGHCLANDSRGLRRQWQTQRHMRRQKHMPGTRADSLVVALAAYFSKKYQGVYLRRLQTDGLDSGMLPSI